MADIPLAQLPVLCMAIIMVGVVLQIFWWFLTDSR